MILLEDGAQERITAHAIDLCGIIDPPKTTEVFFWMAVHTACGICSRRDVPQGMENAISVILCKLLSEGITSPVKTVRRGDTAITYMGGTVDEYKAMLAPFIKLSTV